jgi:hypothetical protein
MKDKRGFEFSFGLIFAIIAGVFILMLAIYGVTKFMSLSRTEINAQNAMTIGVLTNPLESSFETGVRKPMVSNGEIRIYTNCSGSRTSTFGKQIIRTSEKTYNKWSEEEGTDVSFQNKYIFSKYPVEGKNFYVFSKPFEIPFKVADLVYITSVKDKYCFVNPPKDIKDELKDLINKTSSDNENKNENFFLTENKKNCPEESTTICFGAGGDDCKIYVSILQGYVQKSNARMFYNGDSLMYAAIFSSSKEDYECQVSRLMNRSEQLFKIYRDKSNFVLDKTGCNSDLDFELIEMLNLLRGYESSIDVSVIFTQAEDMNMKNKNAECKLW